MWTLSADCPTNVTITPSTGTFKEGDVLSCSADGYDPTYTWTGTAGVDGGIVSQTGDEYTLPEGPFNVVCIATVTELSCCDYTTLNDTAYSKYQQESRAISGKTVRRRFKFWYILKLTAASCGFSVIASLLN